MKEEHLKRRHALQVAIEHFGSKEAMAGELGFSKWYINRWLSRGGVIPFKTAYQIDLSTNHKAPIADLTGYPLKRIKPKSRKTAKEGIEMAVGHFGGLLEMADALNVRYNAARCWLKKGNIPFDKAYQIDVLTHGKIKLSSLIPDAPVKICDYKK
jgi:DNA-binding transcriptional regulator YdaS (Cro superfamily)